jgi:hypothetical protein
LPSSISTVFWPSSTTVRRVPLAVTCIVFHWPPALIIGAFSLATLTIAPVA